MKPTSANNSSEEVDLVSIGTFVVGITLKVDRLPVIGEGIIGEQVDVGPGGKGSNLAVAAARQGAGVAMITQVGNDSFAQMAYNLYAHESVESQYVFRSKDQPTGLAFAFLLPDGSNSTAGYYGASGTLCPAQIEAARPLVEHAKVVATEFGLSDEAIQAAINLGRRYDCIVIADPGPARAIESSLMKRIDILTPNEGEARILVGLAADDDSVPILDVAYELAAKGPRWVIITRGRDGVIALERNTTEPFVIEAYPVTCVDTVGAGDAFNGGLAVALAGGISLPDACYRAAVTGALATTGLGTITPLPSSMEVNKHLNAWKQ